MTKYSDFDVTIDRRNTNCAKWDSLAKKYGKNDLIHLGVADMDFQAPRPILDAMQKVIEHGILGYTDLNDAFYSSIENWVLKKTGIKILKEWIVFCPRINIASSVCIESITQEDGHVIINAPAYSPLVDAIVKNKRTAIMNPLKRIDDRFVMDFDHLEKIVNDQSEMFILVNPDNPSGRAWSKEELNQLAVFCKKHHLILFSDEIHADILAKDVEYTSVLTLLNQLDNKVIYANSLTKTFNIPGVIVSYMVIPDPQIRQKVEAEIDRIGMHNPNIFSLAAVEAGYSACDTWLASLNSYIDANEAFVREYMSQHMPKFHILPREGTYLLWIDCSKLGISEEKLEQWFIEQAKVEVYMGSKFGKEGQGYIRVNLATSKSRLDEALLRMKNKYTLLDTI